MDDSADRRKAMDGGASREMSRRARLGQLATEDVMSYLRSLARYFVSQIAQMPHLRTSHRNTLCA
jgi:hypothetical protein